MLAFNATVVVLSSSYTTICFCCVETHRTIGSVCISVYSKNLQNSRPWYLEGIIMEVQVYKPGP